MLNFISNHTIEFLTFCSLVLSFIIAYWTTNKTRNKDAACKRLEFVNAVFQKLEKHLYKYKRNSSFKNTISEAYTFMEQNRLLVGYDLFDKFKRQCEILDDKSKSEEYKSRSFNSFCNYFISYYNKLCKDAGFPHITLKYRLSQGEHSKFGKARIAFLFYFRMYLYTFILSFLIFTVIMLFSTFVIFLVK